MTPVEKDHGAGLNAAVAAVLRGEKAASGLTLEELSERSGIPVVSVQRFLAAKRAIDVSVLAALCTALGIEPPEVIEAAQTRLQRQRPDFVFGDPVIETKRSHPSSFEDADKAARDEDREKARLSDQSDA